MGTIISFKFVTPVYQKDLSLLQNSSILKQINLLHENKKHIHFLQNEIVYKKKLKKGDNNPLSKRQYMNYTNYFKMKFAQIFPMHSGKDKSI